MVIGLIIIFGSAVGIVCFTANKGSGYGLWWDVILGVSGSIISSFIVTVAYLFNYFGKADAIGFNWYSISVEVGGALTAIYLGLAVKNRVLKKFAHMPILWLQNFILRDSPAYFFKQYLKKANPNFKIKKLTSF